jgi:hypothetical protein
LDENRARGPRKVSRQQIFRAGRPDKRQIRAIPVKRLPESGLAGASEVKAIEPDARRPSGRRPGAEPASPSQDHSEWQV